ncbi:MAG: flagellar basal-body MS-ring/collar protein FliF [Methylococcales bacterium]
MSEQTVIDNDSELVEPSNELVAEPSAPAKPAHLVISHPVLRGLAKLPITHQLGLMLGLALSVAIGVAVVLWSQEPTYSRLYAEVPEKDISEILDFLNTQGVPYKVEAETGTIKVLADQVNDVKLKLAAKGLPKDNSFGYELLDKDQPMGASKSVEAVRFQRVLEGEIARTIMSIQSVKTARVLLAIPVQSVFVRDRKKASASVLVNLYKGRALDKGQVDSIVHLVAASVPQLEAEQVTVVDQTGRLLNIKEATDDANLTTKQFEFKKNIEEHLMERITNILTPVVGSNGMRAQISADVDFTETDKTQEMFNPDLPALRSEQTSEEQNTNGNAQGVPGALSNQPTPAGTAPETLAAAGQSTDGKSGSAAKTATRNFELDKTITHQKLATGILRRLSVAVVVDDKHLVQADGSVKFQAYAQEDITRFTDLVKQAVGFDSSRGDQVTVTNVTFKTPEELEALPEPPLWEQAWFLDLVKQVAAVLVVIFLVLGVLRPTMRRLGGRTEEEIRAELLVEAEAKAAEIGGKVSFDENGVPIAVPSTEEIANLLAPPEDDLLLLDMPQSYEHRLEYVKRLIDEDPQIVAQVIKSWIKKDG